MQRFILALAFVLFTMFVFALRAEAQEFPARAQEIVQALYERNLVLAERQPGESEEQDQEQRRALTRKIIEQIVFEFPNEGWGGKSGDPGRPFSKDSIARCFEADLARCQGWNTTGRMFSWDWQDGTSRRPAVPPMRHDITGQNFIPVAGVDHLGTNGPPVPPPPPPGNNGDLEARLADLERRYAELDAAFRGFVEATIKHVSSIGAGLQGVTTGLNEIDAEVHELFNLSDNRCSKGRVAGLVSVRVCPEPRK